MQARTFLIFAGLFPNSARLWAGTVLLVLLAGCAGPSISPEERAVLERPARALEARGEWREAATLWQQTAQTAAGDIAIELQLNAADALLQAGDGLGAAQIARGLPASLPATLSIRRALTLADASLQTGDPIDALQRAGPALKSTDPDTLARYRRIRADALEMSGDPMAAARERAFREPLLRNSQARFRNRQQIWELLAQVPMAQLEAAAPPPVSAHSGWVELAVIAKRHALDVDQLDAAISNWTIRYPGHAAGEEIVPEIIELARAAAQPPGKVALLLPQTGPFAGAAAAIREGFMAAWYADAPNEHRPEIVLIDTNAQEPALAYSSAVNDGAQFVVGPLAKESVRAVIDDTALSVTTLALNYPRTEPTANDPAADTAQNQDSVEQPPQTGVGQHSSNSERDLGRVYFFALSPEDEARRAAEYAYERGARQAAVLSAAGTWGDRVADAFVQRFKDLGGLLAASVQFPEEAQGLSAAVEQLLNIDRSKARAKQLRSVLVRRIKHEPQPRSDIDVIFIAAFPQAARQIKPLLLFHRATHVPVIATSHVYEGSPDPPADLDLNDVIFADMPWVVTPDAHSLPTQAHGLWPDSKGASGRLYAFGADAYALIARLRELRVAKNASYPGLTGRLSLNAQRQLRRDMQWSRFVEGSAQPIDAATQSANWPVAGQ